MNITRAIAVALLDSPWYKKPEWIAVGLTAIYVGITAYYAVVSHRTMKHILRQADIAKEAADAARVGADAATRGASLAEKSLKVLNRPYLAVDSWQVFGAALPGKVEIRYRIYNPSHTAARIETIEIKLGLGSAIPTDYRLMLTPNEGHEFTISATVGEGEKLQIRGRITYTDMFHATRHRRFAKVCHCHGYGASSFADPDESVNLNDEEEWGQDYQA